MNLLLNIFQTFWDNFVMRITRIPVLVALGCTILGVVFSVLGARVARAVKKTNHIDDNDSVLITFKVFSLVFLFVAVLLVVFGAGV